MILNTSQTAQLVYDTNFNPVDILPKFLMSDGILPKPPKDTYEVTNLPYPWAKRTDLTKELAKNGIKTVIICRKFGLGDIVQLMPSILYLQENYPHINFIFATIPDFIPLFQSDDRYKVVNARYIDTIKYDLGVNLDYSVEYDLMSGSDLRFKHRINTYAGILGITLKNPVIDLKISKEALVWANSLIEKSRANKKKVVVLQLEGASVSRQLPRDLMLHLAKTLNQLCDVVLVDKNSVKADVTYNLTGKTDLQQLMAIIKVADALISFDSGCLWLSHITKTPILTLMGPTRPQEKLSLHPLYPERAKAVMINKVIGCPESCLYQPGKWCGGQSKCMANFPSEFYDEVIIKIAKETAELLSIEKPHRYVSANKQTIPKIPSPPEVIDKKPEAIIKKDKTSFIEQGRDRVVAFVTISGDYYSRHLAQRVKNSFFYFHPSLSFYIFTLDDEKRLLGNIIPSLARDIKDPAMLSLRFLDWLKKRYDTVIKLDADVVITSVLDEFLKDDYDVAGSLNVQGINPNFENYLNLGVTAVRSKEFAKKWQKLSYDVDFIQKNNFNFYEQDVLNYIAHSKNYKLKIVDEKDCYYNETSREHWNKIEIIENKLFVNNRQIKALHWAGGGILKLKISHPFFNSPTRKFLNKVTKTTDFTNENL